MYFKYNSRDNKSIHLIKITIENSYSISKSYYVVENV